MHNIIPLLYDHCPETLNSENSIEKNTRGGNTPNTL